MSEPNKQNEIMNKIENAIKKRDVVLLYELLETKPNLDTERGGRILWNVLDNVEIATMLVEAGAKVNMSGTAVYKRETSKYRFLHSLASRGDDREYLRLARLMMERGADVRERDEEGNTALHLTVKEGSVAFAKELLKRGADVEATNEDNTNPIHVAINGILDGVTETKVMLPLLIKSGDANAETIKRRGVMAFRHSLYEFRNLTEPMQVLLDLGIRIDALDDGVECDEQEKFFWWGHDCMPLCYTSYFGHLGTVEFFLKHGADINKQSKCGKSPFTMAIHKESTMTITTLLKRGVNIHTCDNDDGKYPIHVASYCRSPFCIRLLVNLGADINVKDKDGKTPMAVVVEDDDEFDETFKAIVNHFAFLMSKNAKVDKNDLKIIEKHADAKAYYEKCLAELRKMKETTIYKDLSVFDFVVKSTEEMALLDRNANFLEKFNETKKKLFPLYSTMLENKIKLAKKMKNVLLDFHFSVYKSDAYHNA